MKANDLKKALREAGINTKKITINKRCGTLSRSFHVRISDESIDTEVVNKVLAPFNSIRRCEATGEILGGGNTFILVQKTCW